MVIPHMGHFDAEAGYRSFAEDEVDWNRPQQQVAAQVVAQALAAFHQSGGWLAGR